MNKRAKIPCKKIGCRALVEQISGGWCPEHKRSGVGEYELVRESSNKRGYNSAWRRARIGYLARHPVCVECDKIGLVVGATEVDHIIAHKGDKELFWDSKNWQALCKSHHSRKTARENAWGD